MDRKLFSFNFWVDEVERWRALADAKRITLTEWVRGACNAQAEKEEKTKEKGNGIL